MSKYYLLIVGVVFAVVGGFAVQTAFPLATSMQIAGVVFITIFAALFIFKRNGK